MIGDNYNYYPQSYKQNNIRNRIFKNNQKSQIGSLRKKIFGDHYNYRLVGLNKQKTYMIQEQKNTQIQKANRMLLERIQKIANRSASFNIRKPIIKKTNSQTVKKIPRINHDRNRTIQAYDYKKRVDRIESQIFNKLTMIEADNGKRIYADRSRIVQASKTKRRFQRIKTYQTNFQQQSEQIKQIYFRGPKEISGKLFYICIYVQAGKYVIQSKAPGIVHKIILDRSDYNYLLKQRLNNNHRNIFELLEFNGVVLQLKGTSKQQISLVEKHSLQPLLNEQYQRRMSLFLNSADSDI